MQRTELIGLGSVLVVLSVAMGCDQGPAQPNQPAGVNPAATSSERKETHPEQPTGKPQSGEVPPGGAPPAGR
jgi:hypothetical protein